MLVQEIHPSVWKRGRMRTSVIVTSKFLSVIFCASVGKLFIVHALPSRVHGSGIRRYRICIVFLSIIERGNDLYLMVSDGFRSR